MVSRENTVILAFLSLGALTALLVDAYTSLPLWVALAALFGLGVVVPTSLNEYLDRQAA